MLAVDYGNVYVAQIALGANDSADNYKEIDEAEYQALRAEQEAALKAELPCLDFTLIK